ncbi:MAG: radical SAM protein [Candidatus Zixiibacteriota bacterium]|jgi:MoaA/NifB/PqqE/SkfB family radical SAM enzyme
MVTGIHFLLTYTCNFQCDHCFLYCGPEASGTFTLSQIRDVLDEARKMGTVDSVYFEGGEPFLYYPIMLAGLRLAREYGINAGVVTNSYWATTEEDAAVWLGPLADAAVADLSVSDDLYHHGDEKDNPARVARRAAKKLKLPVGAICIDEPTVKIDRERGAPVVAGGAMMRGRAADNLAEGLPRRPWEELAECPHEDLRSPGRVHVDSFGHVHLCQGLSMGNMWETPLAELVRDYDPEAHPICGPLLRGGPAELARAYDVPHEDGYVDECHLCFEVRKALIGRFPEYLAPRQVYGLDNEAADGGE